MTDLSASQEPTPVNAFAPMPGPRNADPAMSQRRPISADSFRKLTALLKPATTIIPEFLLQRVIVASPVIPEPVPQEPEPELQAIEPVEAVQPEIEPPLIEVFAEPDLPVQVLAERPEPELALEVTEIGRAHV